MRKFLIGLAVLIVFGGIFYLWLARPDEARLPVEAVMGKSPEILPPRRQVIPTVRIAEPVGWNGGTPVAAPGLRVNAFASGLDHPRWMYRLSNGDVLVAETNSPPREGGGITGWVMKLLMGRAGAGVPSANRITLLRDANRDGVAEARSVLLDGLNSPFGMAVVGDWLYVGNTDALVRYPFRTGQTRITAAPEKIVDLPGGENHWTRNIVASPDGSRIFVAVGSASNIAEKGLEIETNRAAILEVDPATKQFRVFAAGLRNPVGMDWNPISGALWTVVNERDMLGSDLPPDYLAQVEFGGFYGWPYSYWGGYTDARVEPQRPDLLEYSRGPDYALGPHTASLGLNFSDDIRLGGRFNVGAFIGQHGSWNRVPPSGYKVVFVPFGPNGYPLPDSKPIDVLTGFLDEDGDARGRPVGVIGDAGGAMLVADDVSNVIWRVSPAAAQ
ncbi:PQQ-dependent sugar dehydrogenase [Sphingomonas baiyangensis]|uniref:Sorbosone dehydrogenase family protein n=1 Tax=Sphingomonas baiyangensis TaxID=2572576 RepID=A0A4U1L9D9_9SPHN|nr:sorbosone dehydrogenase family protein [Sphingomonas baiyangensis]TKD53035.1 sorbosone dehydrogenase family protein [Sphingomonas baiyangensis]